MKISEVELPSNKKFGFFFALVFAVATGYLYLVSLLIWAYIFFLISLIFLILTIIKADVLLPINKLWMKFALFLGMIVSPIVLGIMFFGLFTPIALCMKMIGRDELRLKVRNKASHWIYRNGPIKAVSFKKQF